MNLSLFVFGIFIFKTLNLSEFSLFIFILQQLIGFNGTQIEILLKNSQKLL